MSSSLNPIIDRLRHQADRIPEHMAIYYSGQGLPFAELRSLVARIAAKLRAQGIKKESLVVLRIENPLMHYLMLLALLHEAIVSCSPARDQALPASLEADVLITDAAKKYPDRNRSTIFIDQAWISEMHSLDARLSPVEFNSLEDSCRLQLSSGTTGLAKAIPLSVRVVDERCILRHSLYPEPGGALSMLDICTAPGMHVMLRPLYTGFSAHIAFDPPEVLREISQFGLAYVNGSPAQLASLAELVGAKGLGSNTLKAVVSGGGALRASLVRKIQARLCANVVAQYSSSETSIIAIADTADLVADEMIAGTIQSGVHVEIVDDADRPVREGEDGIIRVRTPYMAASYADGADNAFSDGWFYPGDRGHIRTDRKLAITGRQNDVINLGGIKIDPNVLERFILQQAGVADALAVPVPDGNGINVLCCAVVPTAGFDMARLAKTVENNFTQANRPNWIVEVEAISRNNAGKALRGETAKLLELKLSSTLI